MSSATRISGANNRLVSRTPTDNFNSGTASSSIPIPPSMSTSLPLATAISSSSNSTSSISIHKHHKHKHKVTNEESCSSSSFFYFIQNTRSSTLPITKQVKRYWKKLNEKDSSGKRSRFAKAFEAFKMGLYFKIVISIILLLRIFIHSSQRSLPVLSILQEDYFQKLSSSSGTPPFIDSRIIIITHSGYSDQLFSLLESLSLASYGKDRIDLDIYLFSSSFCNYLPLFLYPLAVAIFGPPRYDHSISRTVNQYDWLYGNKNLIASRTEADLIHSWQSNRATVNESLIFINAKSVVSVSPAYYSWMKKVRSNLKRGGVTSASVISFDSVSIPKKSIPNGDHAVLLEQFFPETAMFSPSQDVWITFQNWFAIRVVGNGWAIGSSLLRPNLSKRLKLGGFSFWDSMREWPGRAWFSVFLNEYDVKIVYPVLPDLQTLLTRPIGTTAGIIPGTGEISKSTKNVTINDDDYSDSDSVHLEERGEVESNLFTDTFTSDIVIPERPVLIHVNLTVSSIDTSVSSSSYKDEEFIQQQQQQTSSTANSFSRHLHLHHRTKRPTIIEDIVPSEINLEKAGMKYREIIKNIGEFAKSRGRESVSLTIINSIDLIHNWICNVAVLDIAPPGMIMIANDEESKLYVTELLKLYPKIERDCLIHSIDDVIGENENGNNKKELKNMMRNKGMNNNGNFKNTNFEWRMVLLRGMLIRDLLQDGVSILNFENDQIWLNDPLPYIRHELYVGDLPITTDIKTSHRNDIRVIAGRSSIFDRYKAPDSVISSTWNGNVNGHNILYILPTLRSRHLFIRVVDKLYQLCQHYQHQQQQQQKRKRKEIQQDKKEISAMDEWNNVLSNFIAGKEWSFSRKYPKLKLGVLNRELFVDDKWFLDFDDNEEEEKVDQTLKMRQRKKGKYYFSDISLWPVIVSNRKEGIDNLDDKVKRATRFGYWFISTPKTSSKNNSIALGKCDEAMVNRAIKFGYSHNTPSDNRRGDTVVELGRL